MNIKSAFKSIDRLDLATLALGAVLCAVAMATLGGWPIERAVSTSTGGFLVAIPMMVVNRALKLKKLFTQSNASNGVLVEGKKWNPGPFGFRLRGQDAKQSTEQMGAEQFACLVDPSGEQGKADAVVAISRETSARLRAEGHTRKD